MLEQFLTFNIFGFFLIFARIGTAFMLLPGISASYVPAWVRLGVAVAVSFVVSPILMPIMPVPPAAASAVVLLIIGEVAVGVFLGGLARIAIGALQTAGTIISLMSSLANSLIQDAVSEQQSSIISSFLSTTGIVLIFVTNLHHLTLQALIESYALFVPAVRVEIGDMVFLMARHVTESFALGLQLAAPIVIVGICYYVGLGIFGRLMPALPVFFFAMPAQIALQFWVMITVFSTVMMVFLRHYQDAYTPFLTP